MCVCAHARVCTRSLGKAPAEENSSSGEQCALSGHLPRRTYRTRGAEEQLVAHPDQLLIQRIILASLFVFPASFSSGKHF